LEIKKRSTAECSGVIIKTTLGKVKATGLPAQGQALGVFDEKFTFLF
jgi:hypothetical protein